MHHLSTWPSATREPQGRVFQDAGDDDCIRRHDGCLDRCASNVRFLQQMVSYPGRCAGGRVALCRRASAFQPRQGDHPLSHHQDEPAKLERLHKINEYHFQQFTYLVEKLAALPEADGTMLDSTLFLYGTGISDSNTHFHDDLPIALVGGKATGIQGGRYVRYADDTPLANLYMTILDKLGVPVDSFGDSNGHLERLTDV